VQNSSLTITFLGTGTSSGVPMIGCNCAVCTSTNKKDKRLRSSILVQSATTTIVVDTTPDFRYQMLRSNTQHVDAILFTHPHKDHIAGLDDVRAYNFFSQQPMQLYTNHLTEEAIRRDFYYAFAENKYPGVPNMEMNTIGETDFMIGDILITPINVWHLKMPVLGFRFNNNFTYITDANRIEVEELQKIMNADVLVLNALRKEQHISHFTLAEAIDLSKTVCAKQTYFTHISHQLGLHNQISEELPANIALSYDGLTITVE